MLDMLPPRVPDYESLDQLRPCPACGSLRWWFDGAAWRCWRREAPGDLAVVNVN
jgi:hypothetical protein